MKKVTVLFTAGLLFLTLLNAAACTGTPKAPDDTPQEDAAKMVVQANGRSWRAELSDNETARAFSVLLSTELAMRELNGNEKYFYLSQSLPSAPEAVGAVQRGDIMLYGGDCIVLFYESFSTPYRYTRIGRIEDPGDLAETLGAGSVLVGFSKTWKTYRLRI